MIYIQLNGGLGNQMFQYAFARKLTIKYKTELFFDEKLLKNKNSRHTVRSFELNVFNIHKINYDISYFKNFVFIFYRIINILAIRFGLNSLQTPRYFIERKFSYNKSVVKIKGDCFLSGYWQSPLYFQSIESVIRKDFKFPKLQHSNNIAFAEKIKKTNSVAVHFRRGDFLNSRDHGIHGTCSLKYYQSAISYVLNKIEEPIFFIFSDDQKWVKENFNFVSNSYYISGNNGKSSYRDMQLMSECKHNIIANSSFSWWGAWLNSNPDKIVIAPKQWFSIDNLNKETKDLIPETWIRL
jgi:hypothetical protein